MIVCSDLFQYFEVDSGTKIQDFLETIMEKLEMKPSDEFKLFSKVGDTGECS